MRTLRLLLAVMLTVAGAGCTDVSVDDPPRIEVGRDICERCGMIIEEVRYAAGYRLDDGTERVFDDLGGMLAWAALVGELEDATMWVHDFETSEWIPAVGAHIVRSAEISSPMGFGFVAFKDAADAAAYADRTAGIVLDWHNVLELASSGDFAEPVGDN